MGLLWAFLGLGNSHALFVNDCRTDLFVVFFRDPASFEGAERHENGGTDPHSELTGRVSVDADIRAGWRLFENLTLQALGKTVVHGCTTGEDDVLQKFSARVDVTVRDRLVRKILDRHASLTVQIWLEQELGASHSDISWDCDDRLVWESVVGILLAALLGITDFISVVLCDVAKFFFDVTHNLELCRGGEVVPTALEQLLEPSTEDTASNVHLVDSVRDGETLVDWHSVRNTITSIDDETSGTSSRVERHDSLDGNVHSLNLECLEHNRSHLFSV